MRNVTPNGRGLGWRRQILDHKDAMYLYSVPNHVRVALPPKACIDTSNIPIWDQGNIGSCTGHGTNYAILYDAVKQGLLKPEDTPSRLMTYYGGRWLEGAVNADAGAEIRDVIKFVGTYGTCLESGADAWPYDTSKYTQRPPDACWKNALKFQAVKYMPVVQTAQSIRGCIAEGFPIVFGFTCYPELDSEEVANTGMLPLPNAQHDPIGGHCVAMVGYDDDTRLYQCRNSWGPSWGKDGHFFMPYEYVGRADLASDFWTIRVIGATLASNAP